MTLVGQTIYNQDLKYDVNFAKTNISIDIAWTTDGYIELDDRYDMVFATDYDEFRQRVIHCVVTATGEIPHRTSWGVGIVSLQNAPAGSGEQAKVASKIRSQLSNKNFFPEIISIDSISFKQVNGIFGVAIVTNTIYGVVTL